MTTESYVMRTDDHFSACRLRQRIEIDYTNQTLFSLLKRDFEEVSLSSGEAWRMLVAIVNIKVIHWPSKTDPLGVRTFFWT